MLKVENLNVFYGAIHAVRDISFKVPKGEIVTLIGSNGAGKSSILKAIMGLVQPVGKIQFLGYNIAGRKPHIVSKRGIALVPEGRRVFANLTVLENLRMGGYNKKYSEVKRKYSEIFDIFPILKERSNQMAATLSGGEQQMLALGRALMSEPSLLMLDEPSLGLGPKIVAEVFGIIQRLNREGMTILLVEQNVSLALRISDYVYVLDRGSVILEGKAKSLLKDEKVRKIYLGEV